MARSSKNNQNKKTGCLKSLLSVAMAGAILYAGAAPAAAAVVVQRLGEDQSATEGQLPGVPGIAIPLPETQEGATQPAASGQRRASTAAPSQAAPAPATPTATPQQTMPLPPTVAPGSPGSTGAGQADQAYPGIPTSPTGYGLYNPNSQSAGPGLGLPAGHAGHHGPGAAPGGVGTVPQPTPVSPLGSAPPDPSMGRYQTNTIPEATAPRLPAQVPQIRRDVARGSKPFSNYSAPSPYSPYMNLFRGDNTGRGINNYYSYVKPALDQQRQDMRANHEIQGLQDAARYGAQTLEQMGQRPGNTIPGGAPKMPATFMNYQQFYPQPYKR